ncbi:MAG: sulfatase-like hydrolase/transferase [Azonexus sp.]|nr:sulfatase-like hydrolase/transferase [Betaproteobacteria bacterium]MBK8918223.1 sulfatase-like hydrolase/transferase [Betaproteobacteria bacterium]MBP6036227.1 sulfatase-like hydrolase/transferase [Azonexus sp.]MBP6906750.1 sulfatase-like hydrolase/transferase [Azonexus sp.]
MSQPARAVSLRTYFALAYGAIFIALACFWPFVEVADGMGWVFILAATAGYAGFYLLPAILVCLLLERLLPARAQAPRWRNAVLQTAATVITAAVLLILYADYRLYELYQFHINKFVINLVSTPGGIAALGATSATERSVAIQVALLLAASAGLLALARKLPGFRDHLTRRRLAVAFSALTLIFIGQELAFAHGKYAGDDKLLEVADATPFRIPLKLSSLFKALGIKHTARSELRLAGGTVRYPVAPLQQDKAAPSPNVIMLVAESFRWDLLDPEITPNLWRFSQGATRFERHYSGGNRTRMGLFSLFYGIYAPYWYSFEKQRVAPVLMDTLRSRNYQFAIHTSQSFDYPELRHTTFTQVPEEYLQEIKTGEPWQRDIQNISDIIAKIEKRDTKRPFYSFMFFESTHAPYSFPAQDALRREYVTELDYIKLNLRENIGGMHARYVNAAHHIDREVARLLAALKEQGMLDNTIVLFTGDHGEEFLEKGHWGHGHGTTFTEEQIRVPFILSIPGQAPAVVSHRTSHLQVAPTLMRALGVTNPPSDYSSAVPLDQTLPYFVLGEYDLMGVMDEEYKISFPYTGSFLFRYTVQDMNDHPVAVDERKRALAKRDALLKAVAAESRRFVGGG